MDFLDYLLTFLTEKRKTLFESILAQRTRHLTIVLEDIYQPQNASAVLRSCDCFGVQDIHIIENRNEYEINPDVTQGSSKWVSMHYYNEKENNTLDCIKKLKNQGYKLIGTTPHEQDNLLSDLIIDDKTALFFGTEFDGISEIAKENMDGFVKIPMHGFTESLNISVSAAICLQNLTEKLRNSKVDWKLTDDEVRALKLEWARKTVKSSDLIEQDFYMRRSNTKE